MPKDPLTKSVEKLAASSIDIEKDLTAQNKQNGKILDLLKDQKKLDEKLVKLISAQEQVNKDIYEAIDLLRKNAEADSARQSFRYRVDLIVSIFAIVVAMVAACASVYSAMLLK